jgi:hypothetical protein
MEVCASSMPWALYFVPDSVMGSVRLWGRHCIGTVDNCGDAVATMGALRHDSHHQERIYNPFCASGINTGTLFIKFPTTCKKAVRMASENYCGSLC